ncbi:DoxX family protein [Mucilaginibacter sp.]|uniref:DoxX family protein n=1 Tax=Mucilaginibacter sp. TaxID=1882438 RepID=UPI0035BC0A26
MRNITGWALSGIVLLLMAASAIDKISGSAHSLEMTRSFGITPAIYRLLGIVELTSVILFIIPKTGLLGLLLLSSYLGGAIATHLQHGQSIIFPVAVEALIWIAALIRYPQLWQWNGIQKINNSV